MDPVLNPYRKKHPLISDSAFEKHIRKRLLVHWLYALTGISAGTFILIWLPSFYLLAVYFYAIAILSLRLKGRVKEDRTAFQMNRLSGCPGVLRVSRTNDRTFAFIQVETGEKIHVAAEQAAGLQDSLPVLLFLTPYAGKPVRFLTENKTDGEEEQDEETQNEA